MTKRKFFMKVILLQDIANLGKKDSIVEVKGGYALNFLIPQKLALPATLEKIKQLEAITQKNQQHQIKVKEEKDKLATMLAGKKIRISKKTNEKGHLFAAVSLDEIMAGVKNELGLTLIKTGLKFENRIKEIGEHLITINYAGQKISFTVIVRAKK